MYIIIGGAGDAGLHLGSLLTDEGHEVTFIDNDANALEKARQLDVMVVQGNVCDFKALLNAGINECDFYAGLVKNDSDNLVSCSLANFYGARTISRVKSPELARSSVSRRYTPIGSDIVLCPSLIVSSLVSSIFSFPAHLTNLKKNKIGTYIATVGNYSVCNKKTFSELEIPKGASIVSIFRGINHYLPSDNFLFHSQDEICFFMDESVKIWDVEEALGVEIEPYEKIKNVFIAGATTFGLSLAEKLIDYGLSVTIIDLSKKLCDKAADKIPKASIINADPLGHGVLRREGIEKFDVLLAMGSNLERNIFISLLAKRFHVPRAITLIERIDLKESIEGTFVDSAVIPNLLLINTAFNIINERLKPTPTSRQRKTKKYLRIRTFQTRNILLKEIKVNNKMRCIGKNIGKFSPELCNFLIAVVAKGNTGFVPEKEYLIQEDDVLFVLYQESDFKSVERWLIG